MQNPGNKEIGLELAVFGMFFEKLMLNKSKDFSTTAIHLD